MRALPHSTLRADDLTPERTPRRVLILSNDRDFAADRVVDVLIREGHTVDRFHVGRDESPTFDVAWHADEGPVSARYDAVWLRQFLPEVENGLDLLEVDDQLVRREQWRTWLTDLAETPDARWMNPLWASRRAENKLVQLRQAQGQGLSVPATLVTNSREAAAKHAEAVGPCVVKTVTAAFHGLSDLSFVFTRPLEVAMAGTAHDWASQPLMVQKEVTPRRDVRVFVVDGFVMAAATQVDGTDWRTSAGEAQWVPYSLTPSMELACASYVSSLGLVYGALDFADDGEVLWFLECNQAGEFVFLDVPLDLGVAKGIADWLTL